jgi:putative flippase GtrA
MLTAQFLKYALGGLASFAIDMVIIWVLLKMGIDRKIAVTLGFIITTMVFSFLFHKKVTFEAGDKKSTFAKYSLSAIVLFAVDIGGAILLGELLIAHYSSLYDVDTLAMAGKVIAAGIAGLVNFLFLRNWVFH